MIAANTLEQEVDRVYAIFAKHMGTEAEDIDGIKSMIRFMVLLAGYNPVTEDEARERVLLFRAAKEN